MQPSDLLIFGGTGFIGSQLLSWLATETFSAPNLPEGRMIVSTRDPESVRAYNLTLLPRVDVTNADIYANDALDALFLALTKCNAKHCAVINLVDISQDTRETLYGPSFQRVYVDLPYRVAAACRRRGVNRLLHVNALGAGPVGLSMCLRSKGDGERVVMDSKLDWTVLRPLVVSGPQDHFLSLLTSIQRMVPFVPLACVDARFQPVYVDDVVAAFINAFKKPATIRYVYPSAGPRAYMLAELICLAGRASDHPHWIVLLPEGLGCIQATLLEHLPGTPISRDNLDFMRVDNVSAELVAPELGTHPFGMEAVVLPTLVGSGPDRGLRAARTRVHRQSLRKRGAFAPFVSVLHDHGQCVSLCGGVVQGQDGPFVFAPPFAASDTTQLERLALPRDAGGLPQ